MIEFLASKDIDVNANLETGTTPLHILSAHGTPHFSVMVFSLNDVFLESETGLISGFYKKNSKLAISF